MGAIVRLVEGHHSVAHGGAAVQVKADLRRAIDARIAELLALMARVEAMAAEVLGFQVEMLRDTALAAPAYEAITSGQDAAAAWRMALDAEGSIFATSPDEHFRARAADLRDIRDGVLRHLDGETETIIPPGSIVLGPDLPPSRFLACDWSVGGGVVLTEGSAVSHVAMLARSLGVPMVVGLGAWPVLGDGPVIVDGDTGSVTFAADPASMAAAAERMRAQRQSRMSLAQDLLRPAVTADGQPVSVMINVSSLAELSSLRPESCDGIGLVRTEFLFGNASLPDEETQYRVYYQIAQWAGQLPVTIRVLDAGGDKPAPGLSMVPEANSFLGTRGIRLLLQHPALFKRQLRALARAASLGNVSVVLPMVTSSSELAAAQKLLEQAVGELRLEGKECAMPPLGIMVEVPVAAMLIGRYGQSAFFSIGTNDLLQYVSASARDRADSSALQKEAIPAVLQLVAGVVRAGAEFGRPVSVCGDLASEPERLADLLAAGVRSVSVPPSKLGPVKRAIGQLRLAS